MSVWAGSSSSSWKGKQRAVSRDEGSGGNDGVVLPLDMVGDGIFNAVYTVPVLVGSNRQNLSIQVDSGSSDLWIASTSCQSQSCSQTGGKLYDPSGATQTDKSFDIQYLLGNVSGPIVWDTVEIGGYSISNQALAAADSVAGEPLTSDYTGILGLALPLNSIISSQIPPVTSNSPDGASLTSNLFSITPVTSAPQSRFISLTLSRPGSPYPPALLGIGRHPSEITQLYNSSSANQANANGDDSHIDPGLVNYSTLVAEKNGILYWKVDVRAITVYVDGQAKSVQLGRSNTGGIWPTAVLDSGVPLILTTSAIANGIYGALGIGPGSDGQYYVPCTTPLNLTVTLDGRPEIPLHPLDLTSEPPQGASSPNCIGLIQAADAQLSSPTSGIGDMILGVPFLRNTYTVMAYDVPDAHGLFPTNDTDADAGAPSVRPRLGLLSLTNATVALDEFRRVRVLNQPLSPTGSAAGGGAGGAGDTGGKKMSVGIDVLIGLLSFFALCFILFGVRYFLSRRGLARGAAGGAGPLEFGDKKELGDYQLARRGSQGSVDATRGGLSEDVLRELRFEAYMKKERMLSEYTVSSGRTQVEAEAGEEADHVDEMGYMKSKEESGGVVSTPAAGDAHSVSHDPWDPMTGLDWGDNTLIGAGGVGLVGGNPRRSNDDDFSSPERTRPPHQRTPSELNARNSLAHNRGPSISVPLLPLDSPNHNHNDSLPDADLAEFGLATANSMAGVGTAARGSRIDPRLRQSSISMSINSVSSGGGDVGGGNDRASARARPRAGRTPSGQRPTSQSSFAQSGFATSSPQL